MTSSKRRNPFGVFGGIPILKNDEFCFLRLFILDTLNEQQSRYGQYHRFVHALNPLGNRIASGHILGRVNGKH